MKIRITPLRVGVGIVVALLLAIAILWRIPSNQYVLLPQPARPLAGLVHVHGARSVRSSGRIYYVAVEEEQASELDALFPWLHPHGSYYPASDFVPPGSTSQDQYQAALRQMAMSQRIAAAVAERQLHLPVVTHPDGVLVDTVYENVPAVSEIDSADVIVGADGSPTPTVAALHAAIATVKPGEAVALRIRRGSKTLTERVKTIADPRNPKRALIGVLVEQAATIKLPIKVSIDLGAVGGPSAGLAFALEVMEKLGHNVTRGYKVAATGELSLDGAVTAIGGVEQKTWGVREAGANVFLVPVDQGNAKTAEQFAGPNLRIIPVRSFAQALHALATLPPAR